MGEFVRIFPGTPKVCRNAPMDHGGLGNFIYEEMSPRQRYKLDDSRKRWEVSEDGKKAREMGERVMACGEIGSIESFRFILTEGGALNA